MNKVILSGRLTSEPELKQTPQGVSVCSFNLAVDRQSKDDIADFPNIVALRQTAEFVSRYLSKGRKIIVEGALRTRTYDDNSGNKRKVTEVEAERIEFADSKPADNASAYSSPQFNEAPRFEEIPNDSELPFR